MKKIFFIHFNEVELKEKIQPLKQAGYKVDYHFSTETTANFKDTLPDVLVISLTGCPHMVAAMQNGYGKQRKGNIFQLSFVAANRKK